jgi:tRNA dimethylallyltransferase
MAAVIAVFGPTASGKTAVAEGVSDRLGTEVVSCDAMQVYRGLPILTNQATRPTILVGIRELSEEMSVGAYATLAHAAIDGLVVREGSAVVSGGTGLYLRAALADLVVPPPPGDGVRDRVLAEVERDPAAAHELLARVDPRAAEAVHVNDRRRLVRALELAEAGASLVPDGDRLWTTATRHPTVIVGLDVPPEVLEHRIAARTASMFDQGVVAEVRAALAGGLSRTAAKTLGLDEIASLPEDEARERIVIRTRRYAAYQRKWMRRIPGIVPVDGTRPLDELVEAVLEAAAAKG